MGAGCKSKQGPGKRGKRWQVRVFLVLRRPKREPGPGENLVVCVKLTRDAAQSVVDHTPGTYIVRMSADKLPHAKATPEGA